jgi:hypothetical protein
MINNNVKNQLINENELPPEVVETVFIRAVNDYLKNNGYPESIGKYEYSIIYSAAICDPQSIGIFDPLNVGKSTTIEAIQYIEYLNNEGILDTKTSNNCIDIIACIDRTNGTDSRKDMQDILPITNVYSGSESNIDEIFREVLINSSNTWDKLEESTWITDPELRNWWDWFMTTPKGQAVGLIICDAIGGILAGIIAYYSCGALAQLIIPIACAALASIGFALWAM